MHLQLVDEFPVHDTNRMTVLAVVLGDHMSLALGQNLIIDAELFEERQHRGAQGKRRSYDTCTEHKDRIT